MQRNPILEQENYWKGYQQSAEQLKDKPELIAFDRLCYELFEMNPQGKEFMRYVEQRYLIPGLSNPAHPNYAVDVIRTEGFKEAFRLIKTSVMSHNNRIKAEINKHDGNNGA